MEKTASGKQAWSLPSAEGEVRGTWDELIHQLLGLDGGCGALFAAVEPVPGFVLRGRHNLKEVVARRLRQLVNQASSPFWTQLRAGNRVVQACRLSWEVTLVHGRAGGRSAADPCQAMGVVLRLAGPRELSPLPQELLRRTRRMLSAQLERGAAELEKRRRQRTLEIEEIYTRRRASEQADSQLKEALDRALETTAGDSAGFLSALRECCAARLAAESVQLMSGHGLPFDDCKTEEELGQQLFDGFDRCLQADLVHGGQRMGQLTAVFPEGRALPEDYLVEYLAPLLAEAMYRFQRRGATGTAAGPVGWSRSSAGEVLQDARPPRPPEATRDLELPPAFSWQRACSRPFPERGE